MTIEFIPNYLPRKIEPKIAPLVKALNDTKLFKTVSSCQGHYKDTYQRLQDRSFADVRFLKLPGVPEKKVAAFLGELDYIWSRTATPIDIEVYKKYIGKTDSVYVLFLRPKDRFDPPLKKRKDTDQAIKTMSELLATAAKNNNQFLYAKKRQLPAK